MTYGTRPSARERAASSCMVSSILSHSRSVQYLISAPSNRSSSRLPSYSPGCAPLSASTARSPSRAHTAATHRQQLDCSVPHVMSVSAFWASASPTRNSTLRILLPASSSPVRAPRLTQCPPPSTAASRSSLSSGVGAYASSTRGIGGAAVAIQFTISGKEVARQGIRGLAEQPLQHQGVTHRIIAVVVVEGDVHLFGVVGDLVDLGHQLTQLRVRIQVVVLLPHRRLLATNLPQPAFRPCGRKTATGAAPSVRRGTAPAAVGASTITCAAPDRRSVVSAS